MASELYPTMIEAAKEITIATLNLDKRLLGEEAPNETVALHQDIQAVTELYSAIYAQIERSYEGHGAEATEEVAVT